MGECESQGWKEQAQHAVTSIQLRESTLQFLHSRCSSNTCWIKGASNTWMCVLVPHLCLTLRNPMDYSSPDSSLHGILQARILEWVAISFSRGFSQPRDRTQVSCTADRCFTIWATRWNQTHEKMWWYKCFMSPYHKHKSSNFLKQNHWSDNEWQTLMAREPSSGHFLTIDWAKRERSKNKVNVLIYSTIIEVPSDGTIYTLIIHFTESFSK